MIWIISFWFNMWNKSPIRALSNDAPCVLVLSSHLLTTSLISCPQLSLWWTCTLKIRDRLCEPLNAAALCWCPDVRWVRVQSWGQLGPSASCPLYKNSFRRRSEEGALRLGETSYYALFTLFTRGQGNECRTQSHRTYWRGKWKCWFTSDFQLVMDL